jgi:hypothetical protein
MKILTARPTDFDTLEEGEVFILQSAAYGTPTRRFVMAMGFLTIDGQQFVDAHTLTVTRYGSVSVSRELIPFTEVADQFAPTSTGEVLWFWQEARQIARVRAAETRLEAHKAEHVQGQLDALADLVFGAL